MKGPMKQPTKEALKERIAQLENEVARLKGVDHGVDVPHPPIPVVQPGEPN